MDITTKKLLQITKMVLNSETCVFTFDDELINWSNLYTVAKLHNISGMIGNIVSQIKEVPENVKNLFANDYTANIYMEANQEIVVGEVMKLFDEQGIPYMPLKGFILKHMYPSVEMRNMCDVDILIHIDDIEKISNIMQSFGFKFKTESAHEFIFCAPNGVTIEFHKTLVPNYNKDLYSYYGDGWSKAKLKNGYRYEMSFEDFYVYTIAHAAKHYLNGCIDIRTVADIYVLNRNKAYNIMDKEYVKKELKFLGLYTFSEILKNLSEIWFGETEYNDQTKEMENYILTGLQDLTERINSSTVYRQSDSNNYLIAKLKVILKQIFPSFVQLSKRYTILKKIPVAYPFCIILRWITALLYRRDNIKKNIDIGNVSNNDIKKFAEHCEAMGLKNTL